MYPHYLHTDSRPLCCDIVPPKGDQLIEIILLYEELTRDIKTDFHRLEKQRKLEISILDDRGEDEYTLRRDIDTAVHDVVRRMTAYLVLPSPFASRISTNHAHEWLEKNIFLALPPNWSPQNIDGVRDSVHNYIVKSVEYQILTVALPQDPYTALCKQQADNYYDDINVRINARLGPSLIHPTFLG